MPKGAGAKERRIQKALRCVHLRNKGYTLAEIAETTGIPRDRVYGLIATGRVLLGLREQRKKADEREHEH